jgi:hypothetical protein
LIPHPLPVVLGNRPPAAVEPFNTPAPAQSMATLSDLIDRLTGRARLRAQVVALHQATVSAMAERDDARQQLASLRDILKRRQRFALTQPAVHQVDDGS